MRTGSHSPRDLMLLQHFSRDLLRLTWDKGYQVILCSVIYGNRCISIIFYPDVTRVICTCTEDTRRLMFWFVINCGYKGCLNSTQDNEVLRDFGGHRPTWPTNVFRQQRRTEDIIKLQQFQAYGLFRVWNRILCILTRDCCVSSSPYSLYQWGANNLWWPK